MGRSEAHYPFDIAKFPDDFVHEETYYETNGVLEAKEEDGNEEEVLLQNLKSEYGDSTALRKKKTRQAQRLEKQIISRRHEMKSFVRQLALFYRNKLKPFEIDRFVSSHKFSIEVEHISFPKGTSWSHDDLQQEQVVFDSSKWGIAL